MHLFPWNGEMEELLGSIFHWQVHSPFVDCECLFHWNRIEMFPRTAQCSSKWSETHHFTKMNNSNFFSFSFLAFQWNSHFKENYSQGLWLETHSVFHSIHFNGFYWPFSKGPTEMQWQEKTFHILLNVES